MLWKLDPAQSQSLSIDLDSLLREFAVSYLATPKGKTHLESYASSRENARRNWDELQRASAADEDVTDLVLSVSTLTNQERVGKATELLRQASEREKRAVETLCYNPASRKALSRKSVIR